MHILQTSQPNDKHPRPLGACRNEITIFLAIFTKERVFSKPPMVSVYHCEGLPKKNFYSKTQINMYPKNSLVTTPDGLITVHNGHSRVSGKGWRLGCWPRTENYWDVRIYRRIPLLLVPQILDFSLMLCRLSCPGGKFCVWHLDLGFKRATAGIQMLRAPSLSRRLGRGRNEENSL